MQLSLEVTEDQGMSVATVESKALTMIDPQHPVTIRISPMNGAAPVLHFVINHLEHAAKSIDEFLTDISRKKFNFPIELAGWRFTQNAVNNFTQITSVTLSALDEDRILVETLMRNDPPNNAKKITNQALLICHHKITTSNLNELLESLVMIWEKRTEGEK